MNDLLVLAPFLFLQNVAFTFVSRGRNSGSLFYHLVAAVFSNGIYALNLFLSVDIITQSKTSPVAFWATYTALTLAGSMFAHWLALRFERGKGRSVQEDRLERIARRVEFLELFSGKEYRP